MLQNARFTAFTVFELLRKKNNMRVGGDKIIPPPPPHTHTLTQISVNKLFHFLNIFWNYILSLKKFERSFLFLCVINIDLRDFPP